MQTVLSVDLNASNAGKTIGYRVLNLNGTLYASFTTVNVVESSITPGKYIVTDEVTVPNNGCRVIFGESGNDIDEYALDGQASVDLSTVTTQLTTIADFLDTEIAAIKAKTDNLPSDPADQSLVEAAISTIAAIVAASNPAGYSAGEITVQQATTVDRQLTSVVIMPATVNRAVLTVKRNVGDDDSKALLQIDSATGLTILNGTAVVGGAGATLSYSYAAKTVDFHIDDHICAQLPVSTSGHWYDVKFYYPTSQSVSTVKMRFKVVAVVTEAV